MTQLMFFSAGLSVEKENKWLKIAAILVANMNAVILFPKKVPLLLQYFSLVYDYCICWKIIGYDEKCIVESLAKIFCKNEMTKFDILLLISIHTFYLFVLKNNLIFLQTIINS